MKTYTLDFHEIDRSNLPMVGGKAANLGELTRIGTIRVPDGFCITTEAFREVIVNSPGLDPLFERLALLKPENRKEIGEISAEIRKIIEETAIPKNIEDEIILKVDQLGEKSYAVRSSATAEDLPTASFAGQQDSYLNIIGAVNILKHVRKCWASLYTYRAGIYRLQNGFDHRQVFLAVIIQKMIFPKTAGIMFTADPVTSNRKILSIDASFGLGEVLVSGLVNADNYKVSDGKMINKKISCKELAIHALEGGGTKKSEIPGDEQERQALPDEQILQLERIGRKIEKHFGQPQDIEWCLTGDQFYIVQSRPITTLFPIPALPNSGHLSPTYTGDRENHVYVSVGHQQMMTDAMKPLGLSLFQLSAARPMFEAAGRLFVDITDDLASPSRREMILGGLGKSDPLIKNAIENILERKDFIEPATEEKKEPASDKAGTVRPPLNFKAEIEYDPAIVPDLIKRSQEAIDTLKIEIESKSGNELMDFLMENIQQSKNTLFDPRSMDVIVTSINTAFWINEKMNEWLGEINAADILSQSVPGNITSEMGLDLINVADEIRPFPEVIDFLQRTKDDPFLNELPNYKGGLETRAAIETFLGKYGMRGAGEIDITRTRWSEKPAMLIQVIMSNIKNLEPGEGIRKFEQGRLSASRKEQELLERLKHLPDGKRKADETKRKIHLLRNFIGYREYPKYNQIRRYSLYRQALVKEALQLAGAGVIEEPEDIYYLRLDELRDLIRTRKADESIIRKRKDEYKLFQKLSPPRVITSDGEIITSSYNARNLPAHAIAGLAVSSGIVEGRARVILNMEEADIEAGDILVTSFTDPSWTPLFVSIRGLVTEVGGLMTHGAVIAREYGLPAIVGVELATAKIKDGQRIRVNGTEGYVEIL